MKEITIEELAYLIKQAKENNKPQPIFFLGAGASESGNIPLAKAIVKDILLEYQDSPFIKKVKESDRTYAKLMECLTPHQRNELLKKYIDTGKINVTHIYLAQLLKKGFVDYVLTVNFDNLMLRALALFNEFPSTHDMAILKDLTTTTFREGSVVYLHGQHHGLWLLNTADEMAKVNATLPRIFDSIKNERPWVFIGYSGSDPVFEHIKNLGRFDNGLYWVGYQDHKPNNDVQEFLTTPNTNAFHIKGYDSDAFMLKLNESLGLEQPEILDKPFSSLQTMLNEINDINDEEHFKGVKERLEIAKKDVAKSIRQYELKEKVEVDELELEVDKLKKEIIDLLISETYDEEKISRLELEAKKVNDENVDTLLSNLYSDWGNNLGNLGNAKAGEEAYELFQTAFSKYQTAIDIQPDNHEAYNDWSAFLIDLTNSTTITITKEEKEDLYVTAIAKLKKAIEIDSELCEAHNNWGACLGSLADLKKGKVAEKLLKESFIKFELAIKLKPGMSEPFYNWGNYLGSLARLKEGKEAEDLYKEAFLKYEKVIEIKPNDHEAYNNWGSTFGELANLKEGTESERLYKKAFEKYRKSIEIEPKYASAYYNWGSDLRNIGNLKKGNEASELYDEAIIIFEKGINRGGSSYNLSCLFAYRGEKENALKYLGESLSKQDVEPSFVEEDEDWKTYLTDPDFIRLVNKYK